MTKFTTAPATATGESFEFNSNAKNVPTFAVIVTNSADGLRAFAQAEVARILAIPALDEAERGARLIRVSKQLGRDLENLSGIFSKHATRAAAAKAASAARGNDRTGATYELVEVTPV